MSPAPLGDRAVRVADRVLDLVLVHRILRHRYSSSTNRSRRCFTSAGTSSDEPDARNRRTPSRTRARRSIDGRTTDGAPPSFGHRARSRGRGNPRAGAPPRARDRGRRLTHRRLPSHQVRLPGVGPHRSLEEVPPSVETGSDRAERRIEQPSDLFRREPVHVPKHERRPWISGILNTSRRSSRPNAPRKSACSESEYGNGSSSTKVRKSEKSSRSRRRPSTRRLAGGHRGTR